MQDKITAAIESYLKNVDWAWRLPSSTSPEKIAREITAAILPLVRQVYEAGENACACGECSYCTESGVDSFESLMA